MESSIYRELHQMRVQDLLTEAERSRRSRRLPRTRRAERARGEVV